MKNEKLLKYFNEIKEKTGADNTNNSEILDFSSGNSIDLQQLEEEYYSYLNLQEEIDEYIDDNDLDDVNDKEEIKKHFQNIDDDCFEFNQAVLKDFVDYECVIINKKNQYRRKANMIFGKNGNGYVSTKITVPVTWAKELNFSEQDKEAIIELKNNSIIISKK